ncbi:MAG: [protein-PII] uridylyltransferase [Candidatus Handelsmanbacteria bacterium RIFCSPLOWO2_12_FULL_64_10]|uniref:Bifunctional uridylyltransferase/uridylyl-removing enzyme n=1 Tax=Handelsmanbacteria sp. (strain RIFCSPLOWO2_12_FULL_64_10) TaxID=1817868 RepID=A0A1F6CSD1_HANXR|nr:MAG: [protein-PII] uridylyltransferase [Candidatus Handelsmanbacteria bacterium RIFCSPLOWO2_12_FULL_64_10]
MHLRQRLDALRRQWESDLPAFDALRTEVFRSFLKKERERIAEMHRQGASGRFVVSELASVVDTIIRDAYRQALLDAHEEQIEEYAVLAQGGYGRGFLNPKSDVDLLFLYSRDRKGDPIIRYILHLLWDLGLEVGHSARTVGECVEEARKDSHSRTAMLEARYLVGDYRLFGRFEKAFERALLGRRALSFIHEKIEERRERHLKAGLSVHLLEPNVKESPGGLRDVHTVGWLLRARRGGSSLEGLLEGGLVSKQDYRLFEDALDFLWRIRNDLHFTAGKRYDVLEHDVKPQIADHLGYRDRDGELGVERFMRDYYLHARNVKHLSDRICSRLDGHRTKIQRAVSFLSRQRLDDGTFLFGDELHLPPRRGRDFFVEDPARLLSLFASAQRFGARIGDGIQREIKAHLRLIDDDLRRSEKAGRLFSRILAAGRGTAQTLRLMHDLGVLGAYLPEFGTLTGLVQYNLYHVYTADEHTLLAIENLERLQDGREEADAPLRRVAGEVLRWDLLTLAVLLHDVGKSARTDDHSRIGADMARAFLCRVGAPEDERRTVLFLIENHLLMSHIAQRRDLDDPSLIADFARQVGDVDRLRMLYLLTYADLSAVTRTAWTAWKSHLLSDLYHKTFAALTQTRQDDGAARHIVRTLTPVFGEEAVAGHLRGLPERYVVATNPQEVGVHLSLVRALKGRPVALSFRIGKLFSEITVCTVDKPYRLSEICGALSVNGINIFSAQAYTRSDGVVLDIFQVTDLDGRPDIDKDQQTRIHDQLTAVFEGRENVALLFENRAQRWSRRRRPAFLQPPRVVFENDISEKYTIIDVFAQDAIGLLYKITRTLSELDLDIYTARVGTQGDKAVDAFYVTRRSGDKIRDADALRRIEEALIQAVGN